MKLLLSTFLIFSVTFSNGQVNQADFDNMLNDTKEIISSLKNADYEDLQTKLGISKNEIENQIGGVLNDSTIDFDGFNKPRYLFPVFRETESEDRLELTIIASEIQEKRNGEEYSRAKYYFVIKTEIEIEEEREKTIFKNAKLITIESEIQKWWLSQYADYMSETKKILERFGYKMPPPALPPLNLK